MSLKDDVNYVTKELSGDEKVLESAFKLETLYKKHKLKLWGLLIVVVGFFATTAVMDAVHESKLYSANEAFLSLQTNSDDKEALESLKENNPALFELYSYSQAVKNEDVKALSALRSSDNSLIADASGYSAGVLAQKPVSSKLYHEMTLFEEGYLLIQSGNREKAKQTLDKIDERSALGVVAKFLKHATLKEHS